jgi:uncharacterized protein
MPKTIFISLPVADVARSTAFYEAIGFAKNPHFSAPHASAFALADGVTLMVADKAFYNTLTPKQIIDAHHQSGALFALGFDSKAEVDAITEAAIAAGGREAHPPQDEGYMYSRAFEDPDGHGFGPMWINPDAT